jgi:hypothetical protein
MEMTNGARSFFLTCFLVKLVDEGEVSEKVDSDATLDGTH